MNAPLINTPRATLDDLARVSEKAELIGGRIVHLMPSGKLPSRVAFRIAMKLDEYSQKHKHGTAYADGVGYAVPELPSGRQSFSPDASLFDGPDDGEPMRFVQGAPLLAVEVRSENDYTEAAEEAIAAKRADYFAAGTAVVWDVNPLAQIIAIYHRAAPGQPRVVKKGEAADAEPALPGWRLPLSDVFPD